MTTTGWIFFGISWTCLTVLNIFCFLRVLSSEKGKT